MGMRLGIALVALLAACAAPRPVIYPDERYQAAGGKEAAELAAAECLAKAEDYVKANRLAPAAEKGAWGAVTGAAIGAVTGAITGDIERAVSAGAAAGGVGGAAHGAYEGRKPDPVTRAFAERCLAEKGYSVVGWK